MTLERPEERVILHGLGDVVTWSPSKTCYSWLSTFGVQAGQPNPSDSITICLKPSRHIPFRMSPSVSRRFGSCCVFDIDVTVSNTFLFVSHAFFRARWSRRLLLICILYYYIISRLLRFIPLACLKRRNIASGAGTIDHQYHRLRHRSFAFSDA